MTNKRFVAATLLMAALHASAADTVYLDGFDAGPTCASGQVGALLGPAHEPIRLGESARYVLRTRSCGYAGALQFAADGAPAGWSFAFDPPSVSITPSALAFVDVGLTVASDGAAGALDASVHVAGAGVAATASSPLVVADEFVIPIAPDTGSGDHHFPASLALRVGTQLRFVDADASTGHRIHFSSTIPGMPHQTMEMFAGQEYDVAATAIGSDNDVYCHDHGTSNGVMHLTVHD